MTYSRIIVAVDVNDVPNAEATFQAVKSLKGNGSINIQIVHVRYHLPKGYSELLSGTFDHDEQQAAQDLVDAWIAKYQLTNAQFASSRGNVCDEILSHAAEFDADLVIVGSHQPSLSSKLLGSNASAIVRNSSISVLVARHRD